MLLFCAGVIMAFAAHSQLDRATVSATEPARVVGSWSCASSTCHGQVDSRPVRQPRPFPSRQSFTIWVEHDPHARAARTLDSEAFERILRATMRPNPSLAERQVAYDRCATCHDPMGLAMGGAMNVEAAVAQRGIGCESCHGAASQWLGTHYEARRDGVFDSPPGMIDLRNVTTRAGVCAACHVGDESHDVDHDLLAAGHPPLRFELNGYHALIRRKHWDEQRAAKERHIDPDLIPFVLWEAGQAVSIDAALRLTKARAERAVRHEVTPAVNPQARASQGDDWGSWPEFAEFDCQACHQRLRVAERQSNPQAWQPWLAPARTLSDLPVARAQRVATLATKPEARKSPIPESPHWAALELSFFAMTPADVETRRDPFSLSPQDVVRRADAALTAWRHVVIKPMEDEWRTTGMPSVSSAGLDPSSVKAWRRMRTWLKDVASADHGAGDARERAVGSRDSWYLACHDLLGLRAVHATASHRGAPDREALAERLEQLAVSLRFGSREFEWPAYDWQNLTAPAPSVPWAGLTAVRTELRAVAVALDRELDLPKVRSDLVLEIKR